MDFVLNGQLDGLAGSIWWKVFSGSNRYRQDRCNEIRTNSSRADNFVFEFQSSPLEAFILNLTVTSGMASNESELV